MATENVNMSAQAYEVAKTADDVRKGIMEEIKSAVSSEALKNGNDISVTLMNTKVDISSGPGALVLDDVLQKLSTVGQTAAQLLASKNRAAKEIQNLVRG